MVTARGHYPYSTWLGWANWFVSHSCNKYKCGVCMGLTTRAGTVVVSCTLATGQYHIYTYIPLIDVIGGIQYIYIMCAGYLTTEERFIISLGLGGTDQDIEVDSFKPQSSNNANAVHPLSTSAHDNDAHSIRQSRDSNEVYGNGNRCPRLNSTGNVCQELSGMSFNTLHIYSTFARSLDSPGPSLVPRPSKAWGRG